MQLARRTLATKPESLIRRGLTGRRRWTERLKTTISVDLGRYCEAQYRWSLASGN
jgi:hypothetical protein